MKTNSDNVASPAAPSPPPNHRRLHPVKLAALVDSGLQLRKEIDSREAQLKQITEQLQAHAEACPEDHVKLKDEGREGTRLLCAGSTLAVPVLFTSDLIVQNCQADSKEHQRIVAACPPNLLGKFYKRTVVYATLFAPSNKFDGVAFRRMARAVLPDPETFITACVRRNKDGVPVSAVKVLWDSAEPVPVPVPAEAPEA